MVTDSNAFDIDTPALLIDLDRVEKNLATMQKKADASGAVLRPHIKAHKSPELARTQVRLGAVGVTASKVSEAEVMADAGIKDIFIANQIVTTTKLKRLAVLSRKVKISVGLDSAAGAKILSDVFSAAGKKTVRIIPNHACTVINLSDKAYGIRRGKVETELQIAGRGKVQ